MSPFTSLCSFLISSTATATAFSIPRFSAIGFAPAAKVLTPSRKMACASTVAVVVPSPATSEVFAATSFTICAPMFSSGSCSSISLATVTPSLVIIGAPNFFSITALRPFGPSVILTASARMLTPRKIACRELAPVTICFAIGFHPPGCMHDFARPQNLKPGNLCLTACRFCEHAKFREDFFFTEDQVFLIVDVDVTPGVLAKQNPISHLHINRHAPTLLDFSGSDGHHFTLLRFLFGRVRNDDARFRYVFCFQSCY